jgi:hypothetical protein
VNTQTKLYETSFAEGVDRWKATKKYLSELLSNMPRILRTLTRQVLCETEHATYFCEPWYKTFVEPFLPGLVPD